MEPNTWKSPRAVIGLIGILVVAAIIVVAMLRDRIVNPTYQNVTITGEGRATYKPDIATITLGVQIDRASTAEDALNQLNSKTKKIVDAAKSAGVASEDISTQNYYLSPQYDYKDNIQTVGGYMANQQLT